MSRLPVIVILSLGASILSSCSHKEWTMTQSAPSEDAAVYDAEGEAAAELTIPEASEAIPVVATTASPSPAPKPLEEPPADEPDCDDFAEVEELATMAGATAMVRPGKSVSRADRSVRAESKKRAKSGAASAVADGRMAASYAAPAPPPRVTLPTPDPLPAVSNTESYKDHGVNPFTIVTQDALSTFSIDVDTASYSIARRKLNSNGLPPTASVRVEEFINYFDYDYRSPSEGPFAVHMEAMPDPFRSGHHLLRVGVQGQEVSRDERQPIHLTFLADVSGSMSSSDKLGLAKKSLHLLVDGLREDDTVALCTYAGRVARILEPTSAANARQIHNAIDSLNSGGSTAMSAGIDIAYEMAAEAFRPGHENRVIVLSDGDANVGRTSWDEMLSQIKGYADGGVTLSTIGFGMGNYKDTLMEQLANNGDGNNFYIDSQQQAQRVFVEELGGTLVTIARDVKIQVEFNPDSVYSYRLIGYENRDIADKDFRNDRVDAGEVGSGHNVTALYDVILRDGYTRDLATVRLRWEQPGPDGVASEKAYGFTHNALKETPWLASRSTRIAYSSATFAEVLRQSPHAAEISLERLARFAESASRSGEKDDKELVSLIRKADQLGAARVASR